VRTRVRRLHHRQDKQSRIAIKEEYVRSAFEFIISKRRAGNGRRGAIVLAAALAVFLAALALTLTLMFSSSPAYGASEANPSPTNAATTKPKVEASIRRGQLNVLGTLKSDKITLRLKPGNKSRLQVDVGGNGSAEFTFKRSAFNRIVVRGASGPDTLSINERFGVFTNTEATRLFGDAGRDLLRGGSAAERLFGGIGNDTIDGKRGNDAINGGDGNDTLRGGTGNDTIDGNRGDDVGLLGAGDDSFRWDPGDGNDVVEGQDGADDGADTMLFNGAGVAENFDVSANGERVKFFRDVANITMDLNDIEFIDVQALGGADSAVLNDTAGTDLKVVTLDLEAAIGGGRGDGAADSVTVNGTNDADEIQIIADGSAVDVFGAPVALRIDHSEAANDKLTVNGLGGADTITGEPGLAALIQLVINGGTEVDVLTGGDGNDRIAGQQANDSMFGGSGDDTLVWDPGDANDLVDGQAGNDTMEFNGAGGNEAFEASAVAGRLRFTRNLGNIVMDVDGTETVDLRALGGADTALVNDLTGTDVTKVDIDLAAAIGGGAGDAAADTITVNGTNGPDNLAVAANGGVVDVTGLFTAIGIRHSEVANDLLAIKGLGGDDDVAIGGGVADLIQTLVDLGSGE
jgi:Ca2+-binding RTX toxin-like protein